MCLAHGVMGQSVVFRNEQGKIKTLSQNPKAEFVANQLLLKLKPGTLDSALLGSAAAEFSAALFGRLVKDDSVRGQLVRVNALKFRRAVPHLRPQRNRPHQPGNQEAVSDMYNLLVTDLAPDADVLSACAAFNKMSGVEYAQPNYLCLAADTPPNDPAYPLQR